MSTTQTQSVIGRLDGLLTRQRLWQYPLALFLVMILVYGVTLGRSSHWVQPNGELVGHDFLAFYMAGDMVNRGQAHDLYQGNGQWDYQDRFMREMNNPDWKGLCLYLNPPHYAWAMSWLAKLSYGGALTCWWMLSLACFAGTILIWRRWLTAADWPLAVALSVSMPAWFLALAGGQNTFFSLLILTGFCDLLMRKRDLAAGLVLSLLAYKFQLLMLPGVVLLLKGRWRAVSGLAAGCAATVGLTAAVLGPEILKEYVGFASRLGQLMLVQGFDVYKQHSWYGFFGLLGSGWMPAWLIRGAALVASVLCLVPLAKVWRGLRAGEPERLALPLAALLLATAATSPHLFHYDMLLLVLPAVLWRVDLRGDSGVRDETASCEPTVRVLLAAGFAWLAVGGAPAALARVQLSPILMTMMLVVLARSTRKRSALPERAVAEVA